MRAGGKQCADCERERKPRPDEHAGAEGHCAACGAPLDSGLLSEFSSRLARFGLGATRVPLLSRIPELPDAE
jgi:hypothetical protein